MLLGYKHKQLREQIDVNMCMQRHTIIICTAAKQSIVNQARGAIVRLRNLRTTKGFTVLTAVCLVLSLSACSNDRSSHATPAASNTAQHASVGQVAIFTPSDGITLSQHTPINKWAALIPYLEQSLAKEGFKKNDITSRTNKSLDQQSQEVQDYVVSQVTHRSNKDSSQDQVPTTIIVAPALQSSSVTRQYGDYTSHITNARTEGQLSDSSADRMGKKADTTHDHSDSLADKDAYQRLVSALQLAQKNGMHVVLLANDIHEIVPDLFVSMSTAEEIGRLQAQQLVSKLEFDKASANNPRYIEVLLPKEDSLAQAEELPTNKNSDKFAQAAFKGIWHVLSPYFQDGRVVCPSGLLTKKSTESDWSFISYDPGNNTEATVEELTRRLRKDKTATNKDQLVEIDGVLAMNDFVASGSITALSDMGYVGTSADINPEISIGGIVGSITGKKDVQRQPVPQPQSQATTEEPGDARNQQDHAPQANHDRTPRWPIVTGYGAYLDNMQQIVDGRQWMTGLEDRAGLAQDIASACRSLNKSQPIKQGRVSKIETAGRSVLTLSRPLLAISASNLKNGLIDSGYIKPADAGL